MSSAEGFFRVLIDCILYYRETVYYTAFRIPERYPSRIYAYPDQQ
jgi:hypothetical protein